MPHCSKEFIYCIHSKRFWDLDLLGEFGTLQGKSKIIKKSRLFRWTKTAKIPQLCIPVNRINYISIS